MLFASQFCILFFVLIFRSLFSSDFHHPNTANKSITSLAFTSLNRCQLFPRCLLFQCCDKELEKHVYEYFDLKRERSRKSFHGRNFSAPPMKNRMAQHSWLNLTLNKEEIASTILNLPPTSPKMYSELSFRSVIKILYLVQGDNRENIPPWYLAMDDMIFLSYKLSQNQSTILDHQVLYFPNSTLAEGRLALYVAARLLELSQGWLYNYFVLLDDDVVSDEQSLRSFEADLLLWQPAVAAPNMGYPIVATKSIANATATSNLDHIVVAYHREAVEILFPYVLEYDSDCSWSSQLMQIFEWSYLYRNHVLFFDSMRVVNSKHRSYPAVCDGHWGFPGVMRSIKQDLPTCLRECFVGMSYSSGMVMKFLRDRAYQQGTANGMARKKQTAYHLMDDFGKHFLKKNKEKDCIEGKWNSDIQNVCTIDPIS